MKNLVKPVFPFLVVLVVGVIGLQISGLLTRSDAEERGNPKFTSDEAYRVFEESKRLEGEGKLEAAAELRAKAKRIEAEHRARGKEGDRERPRKEGEREGDGKEKPKERIISEEAFLLLKKAKALRTEGRIEAAEELEMKAKRIEAEARERKKEGDRERAPKEKEREGDRKQEPKERMISEEARELLQKAKALRAEGRIEAAEELEIKAKRIEMEIRGREREGDRERERPEERPRRDLVDELRGELLAAQRRVEELSRRLGPRHPELIGAKEAVGMLERQLTLVKAERVAQEYKEAGKRPPEEILRILNEPREIQERERREGARAEMERAMQENFQMARRLRAEGRMDAAEMHLREAEAIRRELEGIRPPREERPFLREGPVVPERIAAEIAELRGDVNRLREELGEVRELLRILIEQREEGRR